MDCYFLYGCKGVDGGVWLLKVRKFVVPFWVSDVRLCLEGIVCSVVVECTGIVLGLPSSESYESLSSELLMERSRELSLSGCSDGGFSSAVSI